MNRLPRPLAETFMGVKQVAEYLHLNEKKVYSLVSEGGIPATKVTGKWMFPRELIDRWMLDSAHGGLLADRLVIAGSDDPLLYRLVLELAAELKDRALLGYTPTGTRQGLELLQSRRVDACIWHWGPGDDSATRHPALLRQYSRHREWVLIRAFRREQGLMVSPPILKRNPDLRLLGDHRFRWILRQKGAGSQRFLMEILSRQGSNIASLNSPLTVQSEREAAAAINMELADVAPGSRGTANEYDLGFIGFGWATFDLALPRPVWFRRLFQELMRRLGSPAIREQAGILGGYDLDGAGQLVWGDD